MQNYNNNTLYNNFNENYQKDWYVSNQFVKPFPTQVCSVFPLKKQGGAIKHMSLKKHLKRWSQKTEEQIFCLKRTGYTEEKKMI